MSVKLKSKASEKPQEVTNPGHKKSWDSENYE